MWFYKLTGGRPMIFVRYLFTDSVSGEMVGLYEDRLSGKRWMANGPWCWFRVEHNS
jgi:hypothetical protein